jgi:hypothetical protein
VALLMRSRDRALLDRRAAIKDDNPNKDADADGDWDDDLNW